MRVGTASIAILMALMVGACGDKASDTAQSNEASTSADTLAEALGNAGDLSISAKMIETAQLGTALEGADSYTVFLPVDSAWTSLDTAERQAIESAENRPQLVAVLRQHIAPGYVLAADLKNGLAAKDGTVTLATMGTTPIKLRRNGEVISLGKGSDAPRIVGQPIVAGNNVVYRIDKLIPPPS